jgi:hypothetical protein
MIKSHRYIVLHFCFIGCLLIINTFRFQAKTKKYMIKVGNRSCLYYEISAELLAQLVKRDDFRKFFFLFLLSINY